MPRFVILLHNLPAADARATHWDLMLEWDGTLRTWALPCEPAHSVECNAEQLADHRLDYLTYEGPVSGDRGSVTRWDEGQYELDRQSKDELQITACGRRLNGRLTLVKKEDGSHFWRVSVSAAPTRG